MEASASEVQKSFESTKKMTATQLFDPLNFDTSEYLVFKMPQVTSVQMYHKDDDKNPNVSFLESQYFKKKHYLKGLMSKKDLKTLNR